MMLGVGVGGSICQDDSFTARRMIKCDVGFKRPNVVMVLRQFREKVGQIVQVATVGVLELGKSGCLFV